MIAERISARQPSGLNGTAVCIIITRNAHAHILPRAGHGRRLRTYVPSPDHTSLRMRAYIQWNSTYACVHVYTYTCNISRKAV